MTKELKDERAAFEHEFATIRGGGHYDWYRADLARERNSIGYDRPLYDGAWYGWQARSAKPPAALYTMEQMQAYAESYHRSLAATSKGMPAESSVSERTAEGDDVRDKIARALHYPAHWDTAAYPTLESAAWEAIAWAKLGCSACEPVAEDAGGDEAAQWQYRFFDGAKWSDWGNCTEMLVKRKAGRDDLEFRPLYTRPAPANKAGGLTIEQRDAIDNACRLLWNYRRVEAKKTIDALRALLATTQPSAEAVTDEQIDAIWDSVPWKDLNVNSLEHVAVLRRRFARALLAAAPAEAKGEPT